ncbi:hypothetical protein COV61_02840 [Candidatus Micrarchaeota archaeon CG11_big_fil_rev_8_21_14_0_20_47_5]|nr:MAG: hypothetical protein AUJ17_05370 [Candidatus Micrarchaeota archaeon CG1_02_47_40]PIN83543.1 MAG: hypothetical protein COV61_02840 [Candidatus Micrarchaeota archaeon CG11_big_fil_rev_8_21_14_0_20_47_5]
MGYENKLICFLFALLLFAGAVWPNFIYNKTINGTGADFSEKYDVFENPVGVAVKNGTVYVIDSDRSYLFTMSGNAIAYRVGGEGADISSLSSPRGFAFDGNDIIISDSGNNKLKRLRYGAVTSFNVQLATSFDSPRGISSYGNSLYIADTSNDRIVVLKKVNDAYQFDFVFGSSGSSDGQFNAPASVFAYDGKVYVADKYNNKVQVFSLNGTFERSIGIGKGGVTLLSPSGVYVSDFVYVADSGNNRVAVFTKTGEPVETFGGPAEAEHMKRFSNPQGVWVDSGMLYVADSYKARVQVFKINMSSTNAEVEEKIAQLNVKLAEIASLAAFAKTNLGISTPASALATCIDGVSAVYEEMEFTQALSKAQECNETADNEIADMKAAIVTEIQKRIGTAQSRLGGFADENQAQKKAEVQALLNLASSNVSAGNYETALLKIGEADKKMDGMGLPGGSTEVEEEAPTGTQDAQILLASLNALKGQISFIKAELFTYGMFDAGIENAQLGISRAEIYISSSQAQKAEAELNSLESAVVSARKSLNDRKEAVANASAKINETEKYLQQSDSGFLVTPDTSSAKARLEEAKGKLYADPKGAETLAKEAQLLAGQAENALTQVKIIVGIGVLAVLAGIAVFALLVWYVFKKRKAARGRINSEERKWKPGLKR